MIESFRDERTAAVWAGSLPNGFPADVANVARRKLRMLDAATRLNDLKVPSGNRLEASRATGPGSTAYGSTINGASALFGGTAARTTWR